MTDQRDTTGVLRDISLLYELSLSVGRSLELRENCQRFLGTLMARKSLDFTAVWVRSALVEPDADDSLQLAFATPAFRAAERRVPDASTFEDLLGDAPCRSIAHGTDGFQDWVAESGIDCGVYALYRLGDIGYLKLYSIGRVEAFHEIELSKLRQVVDQFAVSVGGCLDHARVRNEELRRRELEQQVLHTQKLESLGILAGGIAHDFNNLLSVILGNSDLMRADVEAGSLQYLDQLETAASRAADLCSQLLAYSGRGRRESRTFDLTGAVEEMLKLSSVTVSKKARVRTRLPVGLPGLEGDRGQVGQVVMNLLTNASEALGEHGGDLRITTGQVDVSSEDLAEFRLGDLASPGAHVFLEVADSGCGIPEPVLGQLFDPFYTTKFTGRGLGLAAVLGIVRSHAGAIRVVSKVGQGTTVRVLFPVSKHGRDEARIEPVAAETAPVQARVLVVDDEASVRKIIGRLLERMGCTVQFAADGGEALRVLTKRGDAFDLVVLDYTMPVLDGAEVLQHLRGTNFQVPVLLMSGFSDVDPGSQPDDPVPTTFLRKPFGSGELERAVRAILAVRVQHQPD